MSWRLPLLATLLLSACGGVRHQAKAGPVVLPEDALGVVGAPVDQTAFDFEPEETVEEEGEATLELVGIPDSARALEAALAPFLQMRRCRLQRLSADGIVVITRLEQTAQAYAVAGPMQPLTPITAASEPVVQIGAIPRRADAWLYRSDMGGDENFQITRLEAGQRRRLTDGRSRSGPFVWSGSGKSLAWTSNARTEEAMDVVVSDGQPGSAVRTVLETVGSWTVSDWSPDERRLLLREYLSFTHSVMHLLDPQTGQRVALPGPPQADAAQQRAHLRARFGGDDEVFVTTDLDGETVHLVRVDLSSGAWQDLTPDLRWDVEEIALDKATGRIAYTVNEDGRSRLYLMALASGLSVELAGLPSLAVLSDLRMSRKGELLGFTLDTPTAPADAYTLDVSTGLLERWTDSRPEDVDLSRFVEPRLVRFRSFDGEQVPAWVYEPAGPGPAPVLIWMHGGPEEQFQPVFNPMIQFLVVELGIAVVAPNIRGSSGYGRRWVSLDDGMRRGDAIADIGALLDWIVAEPSLDGEHVGIYGASYGGFATLAALSTFPERLAAGCDMVGVSNLVTFLERTSPYRQDQRRAEYGDERDPDMRSYLYSISPVSNADKIRSPLFVAHGANDPRVPLEEARQIVQAVEANEREVWLMVAADEGHGFTRRRNRDRFYAAMMTFFRQHLWDDDTDEPEDGDEPGLSGEASGDEAAPDTTGGDTTNGQALEPPGLDDLP